MGIISFITRFIKKNPAVQCFSTPVCVRNLLAKHKSVKKLSRYYIIVNLRGGGNWEDSVFQLFVKK